MTILVLEGWAELRPHPASGVRLRHSDAGATLYDRQGSAHALDDVALALWELCDGDTTVAEMVAAVCALFSAETAAVAHDVTETLEALRTAGLLAVDQAPSAAADRTTGGTR